MFAGATLSGRFILRMASGRKETMAGNDGNVKYEPVTNGANDLNGVLWSFPFGRSGTPERDQREMRRHGPPERSFSTGQMALRMIY